MLAQGRENSALTRGGSRVILKYNPDERRVRRRKKGGWGVGTMWLLVDIMFSCALYNSGWCQHVTE